MADVAEIEEMIIARLAEQKRCDPAMLRAELEAEGSDMPADSHRLVRAVAKLKKELEIDFKWDKSLRPVFKSVRKLAVFLQARQGSARRAA
jgi:acyl carrier protein